MKTSIIAMTPSVTVKALPLVVALLAGCGGGSGGGGLGALPAAAASNTGGGSAPATPGTPAAPNPYPLSAMSPAEACAGLKGYRISEKDIALPTKGAIVSTTALLAAKGAVGEYCDVNGSIKSIDPSAPPIQFNLTLPTGWNKKAMQFTGGGYDGYVVSGAGPVPHAYDRAPPIAKGYAGFGSDSGHASGLTGAAAGLDGSFGLNDEAIENYFGDQLRKTRDVAVNLITQRYGSAPERTYISGSSGGGREALYAADRWPSLYDGVIAIYPVWSAAGLLGSAVRTTQAITKPGAWSNPTKQKLVSDSVVAACDSLDGVVDGVVSNVGACQFDLQSLRCPSGTDEGDTCLSDAQLTGLQDGYAAKKSFPYAFANGIDTDPPFLLNAGVTPGMGSVPPTSPTSDPSLWPAAYGLLDSWVRYFVLRDPSADTLQFSLTGNGYIQQRMKYISSRMDVNPDLSAFAAKGGKVILAHGTTDALVSSEWSDEFYRRATATMGSAAVTSSIKYYKIPGLAHGGGAFFASVDTLTALERWVEDGVAPAGLIVSDMFAPPPGRARPMCEAPTWPKYNGTGDVNAASSYTCVS